jgi:acyl-CoA thioesterase FadM
MRRRVLIFGYEVYRQATDELLAEGETVHVITDCEGHPRSLPDKYRDLFVAGPKEPGHGTRDTGHAI